MHDGGDGKLLHPMQIILSCMGQLTGLNVHCCMVDLTSYKAQFGCEKDKHRSILTLDLHMLCLQGRERDT